MNHPMSSEARARVVFLDRSTLPAGTELREFAFPHELVVYGNTPASAVAERIADAEVVITNKVPIGRTALEAAKKLRVIGVAATGFDNIDVDACNEKGVTVSNIRNYATSTVPEHTFALILALRRSLLDYRDSVRAGRWQDSGQFCYFDHPIKDLSGAVLGIVGDGALGQAVGALGRAFGMEVRFSAYKGTRGMGPLYTPFEEIMRSSDIITLHSPLTPSTRNMIGAAEFGLMERRPLLINTARGGLVDETALVDALRSGRISGAGFDVVTVEPPRDDHPFAQARDLPNFILTPHVAWASEQATQTLADQLIENINLAWAGTPRHVVS